LEFGPTRAILGWITGNDMTATIIADNRSVASYARRIELRAQLARRARLCNQIERAIAANQVRRLDEGESPAPLNRVVALVHK
jgi:hypothetical protein